MPLKPVGKINVGALGAASGGGPRRKGGLKAIGKLLAPATQPLQPLGKKVKALTEDVGQRGNRLVDAQIERGDQAVRARLAEVLPEDPDLEPGSLNDDLSPEEIEEIDAHLEGIMDIVGELDTRHSQAVMATVGAIFDACHPSKGSEDAREDRRARGQYAPNPSRLDRASRPHPDARRNHGYAPRNDDQYDYDENVARGSGPVDVMGVDPVSGAVGMPSVRYNDDEWR